MTQVKERPILFKADMIRAILNTKPGVWPAEPIDATQPFKWQTRRVCGQVPEGCELRPKPPGSYHAYHLWDNGSHTWKEYRTGPLTQWMLSYVCEQTYWVDPTDLSKGQATREWESTPVPSPHGKPGDQLWIKETFAPFGDGGARWFKAGIPEYMTAQQTGKWIDFPYKIDSVIEPPMDLKWRPSIFMPRWASRLDLEIKAVRVERVQQISEEDCIAEGIAIRWPGPGPEPYRRDLPAVYSYLWDKVHKKCALWSSNPWVWVVEFMRLTR